ncbi:hypothetical protein PFISCL1PPCAC_16523, partial [Pristionchus fissidentatus]
FEMSVYSLITITVTRHLVLVVRALILILVDVEVSELISVLGRSHHTEPVTEGVALEVLLGEVLEVSLGEGDLRGEDNAGLVDLNLDAADGELTGLSSDLDLLAEEVLEVLDVENLVLDGALALDVELHRLLLLLEALSGLGALHLGSLGGG